MPNIRARAKNRRHAMEEDRNIRGMLADFLTVVGFLVIAIALLKTLEEVLK